MITITENADLGELNTMRMRVKARRLIRFTDVGDLPQVRQIVADDERILVMGAGSNLLFTGDYDGSVILPDIRYMEFSGSNVTAGAGVIMDDLIAACCDRGLWGLENLSGIPGKVGASVVQNVGAYGVEAGDRVMAVWVYDLTSGLQEKWSADDCRFGYRDSAFKHTTGKIILGVSFDLSPVAAPKLDYGNLRQILDPNTSLTPSEVRHAVIGVRNAKLPDPAVTGSAGSFFKNPVISPAEFEALKNRLDVQEIPHYAQPDGVKVPAAWLIERAGFKGCESGGAAVWHLQPLVIVNQSGEASPEDILGLEKKIVDGVARMSGITLTPEVVHI